ncbi:MAG: hypothetical protein WCT08_03565 [Patescibacteria group bacterium]|jgi:hypothetical protein
MKIISMVALFISGFLVGHYMEGLSMASLMACISIVVAIEGNKKERWIRLGLSIVVLVISAVVGAYAR